MAADGACGGAFSSIESGICIGMDAGLMSNSCLNSLATILNLDAVDVAKATSSWTTIHEACIAMTDAVCALAWQQLGTFVAGVLHCFTVSVHDFFQTRRFWSRCKPALWHLTLSHARAHTPMACRRSAKQKQWMRFSRTPTRPALTWGMTPPRELQQSLAIFRVHTQ